MDAEGGVAEPPEAAMLPQGKVAGAETEPPGQPNTGEAKAEPPGVRAAGATGGRAAPLPPSGTCSERRRAPGASGAQPPVS